MIVTENFIFQARGIVFVAGVQAIRAGDRLIVERRRQMV